jgi:MFS family permease
MQIASPHRPLVTAAYLSSATFGAFWGTWGASVPRMREQTGIDDAALGTALLFISAGALPAMLLAGRALDRWGLRCTAPLIVALGLAGVATALTSHGLVSLCAALVGVGMTSGAADIALNSVGGRAERRSGRPVITRAGAVFSAAVVVSSLGTGAAFAVRAPTWLPFAVVLLLSVLAGAVVYRVLPAGRPEPTLAADGTSSDQDHAAGRSGRQAGRAGPPMPVWPLLLVGALGALAFASENAHQSWGAVYLEDVLATGPGLSAIAPAAFAATVAVTRVAVSTLHPSHARTVLVLGALVAGAGATVLALAPSVPVALAGLVIAAAGTAALFPTLLSIVSRDVVESARGRATSIVTVVAYLGFLLGPVYVGLWAAAAGLRGAMIAVAALGVALAALTLPLLRLSRFPVASRPGARRGEEAGVR